jgi:hypothetical protein
VAGNLLRDPSECESLADQILNTVFRRYVGANDIANASDAGEVRTVLCEYSVRVLGMRVTRCDLGCFPLLCVFRLRQANSCPKLPGGLVCT